MKPAQVPIYKSNKEEIGEEIGERPNSVLVACGSHSSTRTRPPRYSSVRWGGGLRLPDDTCLG